MAKQNRAIKKMINQGNLDLLVKVLLTQSEIMIAPAQPGNNP